MEERILSILAGMKLEEKLGMLSGADLWNSVPNRRLGIPVMKVSDGPNGVRGSEGPMASPSAVFPVGAAMGATWNPELIEEVGESLAEEAKTKGAHILLAPAVNMQRTPLAGRNFECFSEDPVLTGRLASAYIRGLQKHGVGACIKHFVCNDQEYQRNTISVQVQERALREIYLAPFHMAVCEAKPWALMTAYNRINDSWASENGYLLREILKEEWGFDGMVISDWMGTYTENAAAGGLDYEMPGPGRWMHPDVLRRQLDAGCITEDEIDDKVLRILRTLERVGVFEDGGSTVESSVDEPAHRDLIRRVEEQAIVLLKNENSILPLDAARISSLAVIGPTAHPAQVLGGGSSRVNPHPLVSPLDGIRARAGGSVEVRYAPGTSIRRNIQPLPEEWIKSEGLRFDFFDNDACSGEPLLSKISRHTEIEFSTAFLDGVPDHTCFSARITGCFTVPEDGIYSFTVSGIGQQRVWIAGQEWLDSWSDTGLTADAQPQTADLELVAGRDVSIRIDFSFRGTSAWRRITIGCLPPESSESIAQAAEIAEGADAVLLFLGTTAEWEYEGADRENLELPGDQVHLLDEVQAVNRNVIVVLATGAPVLSEWTDRVPGLLQTWYGGEEVGTALAKVLFGDTNPSGRLPQTWPRRIEDTPTFLSYPGENGRVEYNEGLFIGYRYYDAKKIQPRFNFGYGLSYTTFAYSNLQVGDVGSVESPVHILVDITNTGSMAGYEVMQLYLTDEECRLVRPVKELKAFRKVWLEAGETRTVKLVLEEKSLAFYDDVLGKWVVEPGYFTIHLGSASNDIRLSHRFEWKESGSTGKRFSVNTSTGELLANPEARSVLEEHLGMYLSTAQVHAMEEQPIQMLKRYLPGLVTGELLSRMEQALGSIDPDS